MIQILRALVSLLDAIFAILVARVGISQSEKTKLIVRFNNLQEAIDRWEEENA